MFTPGCRLPIDVKDDSLLSYYLGSSLESDDWEESPAEVDPKDNDTPGTLKRI